MIFFAELKHTDVIDIDRADHDVDDVVYDRDG